MLTSLTTFTGILALEKSIHSQNPLIIHNLRAGGGIFMFSACPENVSILCQ
jgi:hypothetical protein